MFSAVTRPRPRPMGISSGDATVVTWASIRAWPSLTEIMRALYRDRDGGREPRCATIRATVALCLARVIAEDAAAPTARLGARAPLPMPGPDMTLVCLLGENDVARLRRSPADAETPG